MFGARRRQAARERQAQRMASMKADLAELEAIAAAAPLNSHIQSLASRARLQVAFCELVGVNNGCS